MKKLYYCVDCKKVFNRSKECTYCQSETVKELVKNAPINILGTKSKGRIFKIKEGIVSVLMVDEKNNPFIKDYMVDQIRKVL